MLQNPFKKKLLQNTCFLFILLFFLTGYFTSAQNLEICAGEEITLEGWRNSIDCCPPPANPLAPWDCWPETQPGGYWKDGDGNIICQNCIDLTIAPTKSTTYIHLTPGYECPPVFISSGGGAPAPQQPGNSYPASPIIQVEVIVENCGNQIGDDSFANLIECPEDNSINVCAPVGIAPLVLQDFSLSKDAFFLSELSLQMEEQSNILEYFTTTSRMYTISDEAGNQKTCETKHHIANQFLQMPEVAQPGVVCEKDLWNSIKLGRSQYNLYADNNGTIGAIMSTCNTPGLICSTTSLGVDTKVPDTYNFWVSTYFEFPDGSICESEAIPFYVDVQAKPAAELSVSNQTINVGEGIALMDLVTTNKSGYWSGKNIIHLMTAGGENLTYFSSNAAGIYKLYYTVKNDFCERSYLLVVNVNDDVPGCTNEEAYNYNSAATVDDGSCINPPSVAFNSTDYPWLNAIINPFNCDQQIELNEYQRSDNTYIYVEKEGGGILYLEDGTIYCTDEDGETCLENNSLTLGNPTYKWACFEDALQKFDWVYTICEGESVSITARREMIELPCSSNCETCVQVPIGSPPTPADVIWSLPATCNTTFCTNITVSPTLTTHYSALREAYVYSSYICSDGAPGPNPPGPAGNPLTKSNFLVIVKQCAPAKTAIVNQAQKTNHTSFNIYPNPTSNKVFIDLPDEAIYQINLTNISGKIMKQVESKMDESLITMNVSDLPKGLYLVEMKNEAGSSIQKLVIE